MPSADAHVLPERMGTGSEHGGASVGNFGGERLHTVVASRLPFVRSEAVPTGAGCAPRRVRRVATRPSVRRRRGGSP